MSADLLTQIKTYSTQLNEAAPPVEQLASTATLDDRAAARGVGMTRGRRGWLVMVAAAVLVLIGIGLVPLLNRSTQETEPATVEEVIEGLNELTPADLPAVGLTLAFDTFDESVGSPSSGVAELTYVPEIGYRLVFVEGTPDMPSGSFLVWDGTSHGFFRNEGPEEGGSNGYRVNDSSPIYPPNWQTDFSDECAAPSAELIGEDVITDRPVVVLRCAPLRGEWTIWVDQETGLILRLEGSYDVGGEVALAIGPDGRFDVIAMTLDPQPNASSFDVSGLEVPIGEQVFEFDLSPFRALISQSVTTDEETGELEPFDSTIEVWYRAPDAWKVTLVDGGGPQVGSMVPGTYEVQVGDSWAHVGTDARDTFIDEQAPGFPPLANQLIVALQFGLDPSCDEPAPDELIGRDVQVHTCLIPGTEEQRWIAVDAETGLVLLDTSEFGVFEVIELEIDPEFPADIFELPELPQELPPHAMVGQLAPELTSPLLDGTPFDLAGLREERVVVLFWASWCRPCLDAVEELQNAQDFLGDEMVFVAVAGSDERGQVAGVVERGNLTMLIPFDEQGTSYRAWEIEGIPTLLLVDRDGVIVDVRVGNEFLGTMMDVLFEADW